MCGGPTQSQKTAVKGQQQLSQEELAALQATLPGATSFYSNEATQGDPYFNTETQYATSDLAKQVNNAKANASQRLAGYGDALPSGFAESEKADIGEAGANSFDQNILALLANQQATKQAGAAGLGSIASSAAGAASGANNSILQAPLQNNFWSNLLGGVIQGASKVGAAYVGA